jgi:hypothetical protein
MRWRKHVPFSNSDIQGKKEIHCVDGVRAGRGEEIEGGFIKVLLHIYRGRSIACATQKINNAQGGRISIPQGRHRSIHLIYLLPRFDPQNGWLCGG